MKQIANFEILNNAAINSRTPIIHVCVPSLFGSVSVSAAVSSPSWFVLALYSSKLHRQSCLVFWAVSLRQLVRCSFNEAIKTVQRVALHVAVIQAKCELFDITVEMLCADLVIDAGQPARRR